MAIYIDQLNKISDFVETKRYVYKDLLLDIEKNNSYNTVIKQNVDQNDLKVWYDKDAVYTSLRNLFTTKPGERFLFPLYGLDLRRYLFQPINESTARSIGDAIARAIRNYEPRVFLKTCNVIGKPDENTYEIDVIIQLPVFNTVSTISSVLDVKTEKFTFIK